MKRTLTLEVQSVQRLCLGMDLLVWDSETSSKCDGALKDS